MRLLGDKSEPGLCECPLSRPRIGSLCSGDLRPAGEQGAGSRARGALLKRRRRGSAAKERAVGVASGAPGSGPHTPRGQSPGSRAAGPGQRREGRGWGLAPSPAGGAPAPGVEDGKGLSPRQAFTTG